MSLYKVRKGKRFGRLRVLTVTSRIWDGGNTRRVCDCVCDCGCKVSVPLGHLRSGNTRSCGCLYKDYVEARSSKAYCKTLTFKSWQAAKTRCYNPNTKDYANYGGRGIRMCKRWRDSFLYFLEDMGQRPSKKHSLDRIDSNGNYESKNCRWATAREQRLNTSAVHLVTYNGITKCITDWSRDLGGCPQLVIARIKRGWTPEAAVSTPIERHDEKAS